MQLFLYFWHVHIINFSLISKKLFHLLYHNTNNCHKVGFGILFTTSGNVASHITAASLVHV